MAEIILYLGGLAGAITAIIVLLGRIYLKLRNVVKLFDTLKEHTEENYLNNLRLVIMSPYMPIEERLKAGEAYVKADGNGQIKAYYQRLQKDYTGGIKHD